MNKPVRIFKDRQANLAYLRGKRVLIVGYGNQGRAFALNLRDSGLTVDVCLPPRSRTVQRARADRFAVIVPKQITPDYDVICLLLPDQLQGDFYRRHLHGVLMPNTTLAFAHGYAVHFRTVEPASNLDLVLVAPHGPGKDLRERFLRGSGLSCFVAVGQDASGRALNKTLALAKAIGCTRVGAFLTTFEHETIGDIFGEQALLCGGLAELVRKSYQTLVEGGIPPENAYLETVQQLDLLAGLIKTQGISGLTELISDTALFGMYASADRIIDRQVRKRMRAVLADVRSGRFAARWQRECKLGMRNLKQYRRKLKAADLERVARKLRRILGE